MFCCTDDLTIICGGEEGQTTVEAAFLIPVLCFAIALLIQPALLLYDRCVMEAAASETCRLAATATCGDEAVEGFARRRLLSLPKLSLFHNEGCDWEIELESGGGGSPTRVSIKNHVKVLPLLGFTASTISTPAGDGCALLEAEAVSTVLPLWLGAESGTVEEWIGRWD